MKKPSVKYERPTRLLGLPNSMQESNSSAVTTLKGKPPLDIDSAEVAKAKAKKTKNLSALRQNFILRMNTPKDDFDKNKLTFSDYQHKKELSKSSKERVYETDVENKDIAIVEKI